MSLRDRAAAAADAKRTQELEVEAARVRAATLRLGSKGRKEIADWARRLNIAVAIDGEPVFSPHPGKGFFGRMTFSLESEGIKFVASVTDKTFVVTLRLKSLPMGYSLANITSMAVLGDQLRLFGSFM